MMASIERGIAGGAAVSAEVASEHLKLLLEGLPRELYDMIQEFTFNGFHIPFTCDLRQSDMRDQHAAQLKLLEVDRINRAKYARAYYGPRTFLVWPWQNCYKYSRSESCSLDHRIPELTTLAGKLIVHFTYDEKYMDLYITKSDLMEYAKEYAKCRWGPTVAAKAQFQVFWRHEYQLERL